MLITKDRIYKGLASAYKMLECLKTEFSEETINEAQFCIMIAEHQYREDLNDDATPANT